VAVVLAAMAVMALAVLAGRQGKAGRRAGSEVVTVVAVAVAGERVCAAEATAVVCWAG